MTIIAPCESLTSPHVPHQRHDEVLRRVCQSHFLPTQSRSASISTLPMHFGKFLIVCIGDTFAKVNGLTVCHQKPGKNLNHVPVSGDVINSLLVLLP